MNKKQGNIKKILNILSDGGYISTTELGKRLGMTTVSAFLYLKDLMDQGLIERIGSGKKTRYGVLEYENKDIDYTVIDDAVDLLVDSGFEDKTIVTREGIEDLLDNHFAFVSPTGIFLNGFRGFIAWCQDNKRRYKDRSAQVSKLVFWVTRYYEYSMLRRKHGFFDGTESLREVFKNFKNIMSNIVTEEVRKNTTEVFIDKLLFHEIVEITEFGKTKTALELYFGKQNSDRGLLERAIMPSIFDIQKYVKNKKIDAVIFTPPTIPRAVQFRDVLRDLLQFNIEEIEVSKRDFPDRISRAQKTLKSIDRIQNARENISLMDINILPRFNHILILDDNFTTGATMNAIAEKLRGRGFGGQITAITITGKFHSQILADDAEI